MQRCGWFLLCLLVACSGGDPPPPLGVPRALLLENHALVTAGPANQIRRWNPAGNQAKEIAGVQQDATTQILSDRTSMAVYNSQSVTIVDGAESFSPIVLKMPENTPRIVAVYNKQGDIFALLQNGVLQSWQFDQKIEEVQLPLPFDNIVFATGVFSEDGRILLAWEKGGTSVVVYNTETKSKITELGGNGNGVSHASVSASPRDLGFTDPKHPSKLQFNVAGLDGNVRIWRWWYGTWFMARTLAGHSKGATYVEASDVSQEIITADGDGVVRVWTNAGELTVAGLLKQTLLGHTGRVVTALPTLDGTEWATASDDGTARRWSKKAESLYKIVLPPGCSLNSVFDSPALCPTMNAGSMNKDASLLVAASTASANNLYVWDLAKVRAKLPGALVKQFGDVGVVTEVVLSPSGKQLLTRSDTGAIWLWNLQDLQNPQRVASFSAVALMNQRMAFSADEKKVLGLRGTMVQLWDIGAAPQLLVEWEAHNVGTNHAVFSQDGSRVATAGGDGLGKIWNISNPAQPMIEGGMIRSEATPLTAVAISANMGYAVLGDALGGLSLWNLRDLQNPALVASWKGHSKPWNLGEMPPLQQPVLDIAFSPSGDVFATDGRDGFVRLWEVNRQNMVAEQRLGNNASTSSARVDFSSDGKQLAASGAYFVGLWEPARATELVKINLQ